VFRWLTAFIVLSGVPVFAHEMRPGYFDVREVAPHRYDVLWKQPALGDLRPGNETKVLPDVQGDWWYRRLDKVRENVIQKCKTTTCHELAQPRQNLPSAPRK
jgi:hypothetical protein